jgi:thiol-disulfide isomerase/thioredoxin
MKKGMLAGIAIMIATLPARPQGVVFEQITLDEALERARVEGKHVLVDCYTAWCGPCREMADKVFPLPAAGAYFNPRFVSVKYDIEKEEEGRRLTREHHVTAIPTFLVLRPDGSLVHKIVGGGKLDPFIRKVEDSFNADRAYGIARALHAAGNVDKAFLASCLEIFQAAGDSGVVTVCRQLVARLSDEERTSAAYWFIHASDKLSPPGSPNEQFLMEHPDAFRASAGRVAVDEELYRRYKHHLLEITRGKRAITPRALRALLSRVRRTRPAKLHELQAYGHVAAAVVKGDFDRQIAACRRHLPGLPDMMTRYFEMSDGITRDGTPAQKQAWVTLGDHLLQTLPEEERSSGYIPAFMKYLREKATAR